MKKRLLAIHKTGVVPVIVLAAILAFLLMRGVESAYTISLWEAEMASLPEGRMEMTVTGGNLLRVNSFYVAGKRVEDCAVEKMTYEKCRIVFDADVFSKGNTWYEIRVGYNKWGLFDLLSSPVWVEWTGS